MYLFKLGTLIGLHYWILMKGKTLTNGLIVIIERRDLVGLDDGDGDDGGHSREFLGYTY